MRSHGPNACIMTHPVYIASFSLSVWINRSLVSTHFSTCTLTHACIYPCTWMWISTILQHKAAGFEPFPILVPRPLTSPPCRPWCALTSHKHTQHFLPFLIYGQLHLASFIQCFDTANDILALLTPGWAEVLAFCLKNTETDWVLKKANVSEKRNHHEI